MSLHAFLSENQADLIARCRVKVAARAPPVSERDDQELAYGITPFLTQLIKTLEVEGLCDVSDSRKISGNEGGAGTSEISETATAHGRELLLNGFSVQEVVHDYGDLCQAISDSAKEHHVPIKVDEFRTLNRCLDNAIAVAVTEFGYQRDMKLDNVQASEMNENLRVFSHEINNCLTTATLALSIIRSGNVGLSGSTGGILDSSLVGLRKLVDQTLASIRLSADTPIHHELFLLEPFIAEIKLAGTLEAKIKNCVLQVSNVNSKLAVDADRDLLFAAVGNLLQTAFDATPDGGTVTLSVFAAGDRVMISVEDEGGGLPPGKVEILDKYFSQKGADRSGLDRGLAVARRSVRVNGGTITVRDAPGQGSIFTIDLPRHNIE